MKKFYCKKCRTVSSLTEGTMSALSASDDEDIWTEKWDGNLLCDICSDESQEVWMKPISNYETPEQHEKRTGKAFPDDGAVWRFCRVCWSWLLCEYRWIKGEAIMGRNYSVVIADPPVPPPDNWRPE